MKSEVADTSVDRLRDEVSALARPEGRRVGTSGHEAAVRHLAERLSLLDLEPYGDRFELPYRVGGTDFTNVVGVAPGLRRDESPVLIGAHYDTAGAWAGADDNAAAVAIALEVAERLRRDPAGRDVVVALFDAEEPPHFHARSMGSTRFYEDQARGPIHAALIMDLVGHAVPVPQGGDLLFVTGMESDPDLERTIRSLPEVRGARIVTALNRYVGDMSDHHVFRLDRVPYLFLSCGHWQHYHRASDTPEKLAYHKMAAIADLLEATVRDVVERELDGPWEGYDTTETDLATMREGLGPLLRTFGVQPRSREDLDAVVMKVKAAFGL